MNIEFTIFLYTRDGQRYEERGQTIETAQQTIKEYKQNGYDIWLAEASQDNRDAVVLYQEDLSK